MLAGSTSSTVATSSFRSASFSTVDLDPWCVGRLKVREHRIVSARSALLGDPGHPEPIEEIGDLGVLRRREVASGQADASARAGVLNDFPPDGELDPPPDHAAAHEE